MNKSGKAKQNGAGKAASQGAPVRARAPGAGAVSKRRALVVGIDEYAPPNALQSCVNDAKTFAAMLADEYGFDNVVVRTDGQVVKAQLLSDLDALFDGAQEGDELVFFFSGHGYRQTQNGTLDSVLVTQDSQFFSDDELAQKMAGLPDGTLTIVLDACFSGGDEKAFVTRQGNVEIGKIKRWTPPPSAGNVQAKVRVAQATKIKPFGYLTALSGSDLERHLLPIRGKAFDPPYRITELQDRDSKGLLLSACLENEEAAASTSQTDGLSAFSFALTGAARSLGAGATAKDVVVQAGATLRTLGLGQTPMLKEPLQPPDLGDASFVLLNREAHATTGGGDPSGVSAPAGAGTYQDPQFVQSLAILAGLLFSINQQGVNAMTMEANQKDFINTLSTLGNVVIPLVSVLQQKGFSVDDAAHIASAFVPLLANKQAGGATDSKDWAGDALNVASTVATIASLFQKAQQPDGKDWTNIVAAALPFILGQQPQTADKSFLGSVGTALHVIETVAPIVAAAQKSKNFLDPDMPYINGGWRPGFPPPYVS